MASYAKSNLGNNYGSTQRRYSASIAYKFMSVSAIELDYMVARTTISTPTDVGQRFPYITTQVTTYDDEVYSINWVQNLVPSDWIIQPYFKFGGGKLRRKQRIEFPEFGVKDERSQVVNTGVGGLGLRIFLTKNLAIKGEFTTYVPDFRFSGWKDSQMFSAGLSWLF